MGKHHDMYDDPRKMGEVPHGEVPGTRMVHHAQSEDDPEVQKVIKDLAKHKKTARALKVMGGILLIVSSAVAAEEAIRRGLHHKKENNTPKKPKRR